MASLLPVRAWRLRRRRGEPDRSKEGAVPAAAATASNGGEPLSIGEGEAEEVGSAAPREASSSSECSVLTVNGLPTGGTHDMLRATKKVQLGGAFTSLVSIERKPWSLFWV